MVAPVQLLIVFIVGGIGSAVSYSVYRFATLRGENLTMGDLFPPPPGQGPPLPKFLSDILDNRKHLAL